jgi:hypothetical protein
MSSGTEDFRSMSYFNTVLLTKVFCPGSTTENGHSAHLGLAFAYSPAMQPSYYDANNGSIQTWLDSQGATDGNLTAQSGYCMNKPAKGECHYIDGHVSRNWVLRYPVVWMMDLATNISVSDFDAAFSVCIILFTDPTFVAQTKVGHPRNPLNPWITCILHIGFPYLPPSINCCHCRPIP